MAEQKLIPGRFEIRLVDFGIACGAAAFTLQSLFNLL